MKTKIVSLKDIKNHPNMSLSPSDYMDDEVETKDKDADDATDESETNE